MCSVLLISALITSHGQDGLTLVIEDDAAHFVKLRHVRGDDRQLNTIFVQQ